MPIITTAKRGAPDQGLVKEGVIMDTNRRKRTLAWAVWTSLLLAPLASADEAAAPSAQALAIADGVVSYCRSVDPASAAKVQQVIKLLEQGASEKQLAEVRNSDEYRNAHTSLAEFTAKIDPHNAAKFC